MMQLHVLNADDIGRIHEATLEILEKQGVWFEDSPQAAGFSNAMDARWIAAGYASRARFLPSACAFFPIAMN